LTGVDDAERTIVRVAEGEIPKSIVAAVTLRGSGSLLVTAISAPGGAACAVTATATLAKAAIEPKQHLTVREWMARARSYAVDNLASREQAVAIV
jgi:hypothetical protein